LYLMFVLVLDLTTPRIVMRAECHYQLLLLLLEKRITYEQSSIKAQNPQ
jgi:hypothetical protein